MNALQLLVCLVLAHCCCAQNDCTAERRILNEIKSLSNYGSEVANTVIRILECSGVFEDDHLFMRRLAYVETRDGADGQGRTGIWNVTKHHLKAIDYSLLSRSEIFAKLVEETCVTFGVDMRRAVRNPDRQDLTDPLVSGAVALFYLHYVTVVKGQPIPSTQDVEGQAGFWLSQFRMNDGNTAAELFKRRVAELQGKRISHAKKSNLILPVSGLCWCSNRGGNCPLPEEWTNSNNANGSEVVEEVLQQLDEPHIFSPDYGFMRRMAYVETRDGTVTTAENTSNNLCHKRVGIWGLTESMLYHMKVGMRRNSTKYQEVFAVSEDICEEIGVNMTGHEKLNMRNPLVSAIAARFYLLYLTELENEDLPEDLMGQALFWGSHYTEINADYTKFLEDVMELEGIKLAF